MQPYGSDHCGIMADPRCWALSQPPDRISCSAFVRLAPFSHGMIGAIETYDGDGEATALPSGEAAGDFAAFVAAVEPRLRRAMVGAVGVDRAPDAVAEALAWAWSNWEAVATMANPAGYLYRVARSASRIRTPRRVRWLVPPTVELPEIEPGLVAAVAALPARQRTAVWLVHACEWSQVEVAEALGISPSSVSTHVERGLAKLRRRLGVTDDR